MRRLHQNRVGGATPQRANLGLERRSRRKLVQRPGELHGPRRTWDSLNPQPCRRGHSPAQPPHTRALEADDRQSFIAISLSHCVWKVALASTRNSPGGRSKAVEVVQTPVESHALSGAFCETAAPPTRGFTVTSTVVPPGTPVVLMSIGTVPGAGRTRSVTPNTP